VAQADDNSNNRSFVAEAIAIEEAITLADAANREADPSQRRALEEAALRKLREVTRRREEG
jgi:hypothetical protein